MAVAFRAYEYYYSKGGVEVKVICAYVLIIVALTAWSNVLHCADRVHRPAIQSIEDVTDKNFRIITEVVLKQIRYYCDDKKYIDFLLGDREYKNRVKRYNKLRKRFPDTKMPSSYIRYYCFKVEGTSSL